MNKPFDISNETVYNVEEYKECVDETSTFYRSCQRLGVIG